MKVLSRNDTVKKVLVKKGILPLVLRILTSGEENEKKMSLKLLWELSFDPDNKMKIQVNFCKDCQVNVAVFFVF